MEGLAPSEILSALGMTIADDRPGRCRGSTFHLLAEFSGALLNGPVGSIVARILRSDVERSVRNLAALGADAESSTPGS
jgi:hypothetical protein